MQEETPPCLLYFPWDRPLEHIMSVPMSYGEPNNLATAFPCHVPAPAATHYAQESQQYPSILLETNNMALNAASYSAAFNYQKGVSASHTIPDLASPQPSYLEQLMPTMLPHHVQLKPTADNALLSPLSLESFVLAQSINPALLQYSAPYSIPTALQQTQYPITGPYAATLRTVGAPMKQISTTTQAESSPTQIPEKRKRESPEQSYDLKKIKLETKALKTKRPGFTDERYQETSYYKQNGLRKVYPYFFTFTTFTKGRWVGDKILEVFSREFRAHPAEEYERNIEAGNLTVNYEKVPIDYRLKHNDLLANTVHRHEVPVTSQSIKVVHMDEDIVVVNKPASIPVHPCGRYRHNTVVFILAKEYNLKNLRTIHRLDRLTSGLLLFGRNPNKARDMEQQIRNRQVQKEYVCRVEGNFPDGVIECNEPIEVVSYKIGVCRVSPKGKDCKTTFEKISQSGDSSVVLCKPLTGRMHQIRVHLQYLGYPIVNDPLYNHEVFGPLKGRGGDIGGKSYDQLINDLIHIHNTENWLGISDDSELLIINSRKTSEPAVTADFSHQSVQEQSTSDRSDQESKLELPVHTKSSGKSLTTVSVQTGYESPDSTYDPSKMTSDPHCQECKLNYRDPKPDDLVMYLHAWKYRGPGWSYETDLPDWSLPNWTKPM